MSPLQRRRQKLQRVSSLIRGPSEDENGHVSSQARQADQGRRGYRIMEGTSAGMWWLDSISGLEPGWVSERIHETLCR